MQELEDQLANARIEQGPDSELAKKLAADLARNANERVAALAHEREIKALGLLPMPKTIVSAGR